MRRIKPPIVELEAYAMVKKPTYQELEQLVKELKKKVSNQRRIEKALGESEKKAQALLNAPSDSAMLIDTEGTILAISPNISS